MLIVNSLDNQDLYWFSGTGPTPTGQPQKNKNWNRNRNKKRKTKILISFNSHCLSHRLLSMAIFSWYRLSLISFLEFSFFFFFCLFLGKILERCKKKNCSFWLIRLWSYIRRIEATRRVGLQVWPLITLLCEYHFYLSTTTYSFLDYVVYLS